VFSSTVERSGSMPMAGDATTSPRSHRIPGPLRHIAGGARRIALVTARANEGRRIDRFISFSFLKSRSSHAISRRAQR
jgi:hypothetical protein